MKYAVVLFNLGGPDSLVAVKPFLFNLFSDRAIINLPQPFRTALAWLISSRRHKAAQEIYRHLGGASPLLANTRAQQSALQAALQKISPSDETKVFIAMRYWLPLTEEAVAAVKDFGPDRLLLLPLYPQFSTTTTGSSFKAWKAAAQKLHLRVPTTQICCYPTDEGFVDQMVENLKATLREGAYQGVRILFSAHGLPQKIVDAGDPYPLHVALSVGAVVKKMGLADDDWRICYQSRVGPLRWLEPSTESEIRRAGDEKKGLIIVPIAFVSEHSETLYELDEEYARLARTVGVPFFRRVQTAQVGEHFIRGLATLSMAALRAQKDGFSQSGLQSCCLAACPLRRSENV